MRNFRYLSEKHYLLPISGRTLIYLMGPWCDGTRWDANSATGVKSPASAKNNVMLTLGKLTLTYSRWPSLILRIRYLGGLHQPSLYKITPLVHLNT